MPCNKASNPDNEVTLSNYEREFGVYRASYNVSRDEDVDKANDVLRQAVEELQQDEKIKPLLLGEPTFQGVVGLGDQFFTIRVLVRTRALEQWTVQYALDRLVKIHFEKAGMVMPRQAVQIYKDESLPPENPGKMAVS